MTGLMTVPTIAAVALAILAAVLAWVAWRQRRELARLQDEPAKPPGTADGGAMQAMLTALREPALLHGERIEAVNAAFIALVGIPADRLVGKTLAELVSAEYSELAGLAVTRTLAGEAGPVLAEVELADPHGQVTRIEISGSSITDAVAQARPRHGRGNACRAAKARAPPYRRRARSLRSTRSARAS